MFTTAGNQMNQMSIEQLTEQAAELARKAGESESAQVNGVRARVLLDIAQIKLSQAAQVLYVKQIELTKESNQLTEKLLKSNEAAGAASAHTAAALNSATEQLAKSTSGLHKATWALVAFTAIQALIAACSVWLSMKGK